MEEIQYFDTSNYKVDLIQKINRIAGVIFSLLLFSLHIGIAIYVKRQVGSNLDYQGKLTILIFGLYFGIVFINWVIYLLLMFYEHL